MKDPYGKNEIFCIILPWILEQILHKYFQKRVQGRLINITNLENRDLGKNHGLGVSQQIWV